MLIVALVTGVNVIGLFLSDPWGAFCKIWSEVYLADNVIWILVVVAVLYATELNDWLLGRFRI
jgi:hypothetical protein